LTLAQAESENPEDQEVTIVADKLTYDRNTQVAQGEGNLEIQQGETVILAPTGSYKRKESQSILTGGVTLKEPKRILKSDRLTGNHKDKIFLFEDNVIYTQLAEDASAQASADAPLTDEIRRAETEVKAVKLIYNSRTGVSEFTDQVEFVQKGRQAKSNQATITPEKVTLSGDVAIEQIQGDWLAKRFDDPEAQADVAKPTLIFADRVEIDQATSDARFFDNVVIVQPNRAAEGDSAIYTDSKQTFELLAQKAPVLLCDRADTAEVVADSIEGLPGRDALDVTCRGATRISSQLITLDVANDTFSATGTESSQSQMTFRVSDEIAPK
jgi:lipopolysaccharide assembly outer membrane protein LptD (OstA)